MTDLTISIVNHSNPELLQACIRSIFVGTVGITFDVWVIDNATDGRLVPEIQQEFPSVKWLFNEARKGFSSNHNQVLSKASARYACILNDDTVIEPGAFPKLIEYMDTHSTVGMAGPRLLNPDGTIQTATFREMSLLNEVIGAMILPKRFEKLKTRSIDAAQYSNAPSWVDWILGACIVVRLEVIQRIGILDEQSFPIANNEEVDWCRRTRQAGWHVAHVPDAIIMHYGGQSLMRRGKRVGADKMRIELMRTRIVYFKKHFGLLPSLALRAIYVGTLPWNGIMLLQSWLRGTASKEAITERWATLLGTARMSLRGR